MTPENVYTLLLLPAAYGLVSVLLHTKLSKTFAEHAPGFPGVPRVSASRMVRQYRRLLTFVRYALLASAILMAAISTYLPRASADFSLPLIYIWIVVTTILFSVTLTLWNNYSPSAPPWLTNSASLIVSLSSWMTYLVLLLITLLAMPRSIDSTTFIAISCTIIALLLGAQIYHSRFHVSSSYGDSVASSSSKVQEAFDSDFELKTDAMRQTHFSLTATMAVCVAFLTILPTTPLKRHYYTDSHLLEIATLFLCTVFSLTLLPNLIARPRPIDMRAQEVAKLKAEHLAKGRLLSLVGLAPIAVSFHLLSLFGRENESLRVADPLLALGGLVTFVSLVVSIRYLFFLRQSLAEGKYILVFYAAGMTILAGVILTAVAIVANEVAMLQGGLLLAGIVMAPLPLISSALLAPHKDGNRAATPDELRFLRRCPYYFQEASFPNWVDGGNISVESMVGRGLIERVKVGESTYLQVTLKGLRAAL